MQDAKKKEKFSFNEQSGQDMAVYAEGLTDHLKARNKETRKQDQRRRGRITLCGSVAALNH
jgi:hypothetical protein